MDARIPTPPAFREALRELAPDTATRAALAKRCGVHPKTIARLEDSLPSPLQPFLEAPELLEALLGAVRRAA
jgi:hypothetical protein